MELEKEFRIGNWYDQFGVYHQANWVVMKELSRAPKTQLWCKPIPLTPEILEKAGFEKRSNCFYTIGDDLITVIFYMTSSFRVFYQIDNEIRHIRYFHQLQNLYFALTGEELQIDL